MQTHRYFLAGLGNIGHALLDSLVSRASMIRERYDTQLLCLGVADSSGVLVSADGIDVAAVLEAKRGKHAHSTLHGTWLPRANPVDALLHIQPDIVFDATPVNMKSGEPGLTLTRESLVRGIHVVTANKAPLAMKYAELAALSDWGSPGKPKLRFSACVGGAMPTINVGVFDQPLARFTRIEAVFNATTQVILERMADGSPYEEAVRHAQQMGIAEADPSLDVQGWDAANKLVILSNTVLRYPATLADVSITGIGPATANEARAARIVGERMSLVATAEWDGSHYKLTVAPTSLAPSHPFGTLSGAEMAVTYESDLYERITIVAYESGPLPSAAAMLRDMVNIIVGH